MALLKDSSCDVIKNNSKLSVQVPGKCFLSPFTYDLRGEELLIDTSELDAFFDEYDLICVYLDEYKVDRVKHCLDILRLNTEEIREGQVYEKGTVVNVNNERKFAIVELKKHGRTGFISLRNERRPLFVNDMVRVKVSASDEQSISLQLLEVLADSDTVKL